MKYQEDEEFTRPLKVRQAIADQNFAPQDDEGSLLAALREAEESNDPR